VPSRLDRRRFLILSGAAAFAAMGGTSLAGDADKKSEFLIARLIQDAKMFPRISQRIEFISRALLGTTYKSHPLKGSAERKEIFVMNCEGFDCVTYCESVLAAAIAHNVDEFRVALRQIRYRNGIVNWRERNHYFGEWSRNNSDNGICSRVAMPGSIQLERTAHWLRKLEKQTFSVAAIPQAVFLANKQVLRTGDIIGFVSDRPRLDYFHIGFIAFDSCGRLMLRHASRSKRRVLDERMDEFLDENKVRHVTLVRPQEPSPLLFEDFAI
jgi:hypothetical protein